MSQQIQIQAHMAGTFGVGAAAEMLPVTSSDAVLHGYPPMARVTIKEVRKEPENRPREPDASGPPWVAECLFVLCTTSRHRESAQGCMHERFERDCRRYGRARAVRLYRTEVLRSVLLSVPRLLRRLVTVAAVISGVRNWFG
jgi:hypothetical protein